MAFFFYKGMHHFLFIFFFLSFVLRTMILNKHNKFFPCLAGSLKISFNVSSSLRNYILMKIQDNAKHLYTIFRILCLLCLKLYNEFLLVVILKNCLKNVKYFFIYVFFFFIKQGHQSLKNL